MSVQIMDGWQTESYISDIEKRIKSMSVQIMDGRQIDTSKSFTINPPTQTGWVCPICGAGLAPWVSRCPCQDKWEITC